MTTLHIDTEHALPIELEPLIGEKIAILGIAGSGKTNTSATVIEEILAHNVPMTIVDIEGEYWGLKETFDIVIIGRSENVDVAVDAANAAQFATYSVEHGVSMILDLADYDTLEDMHDFLIAYFEALWQAVSKLRRPYFVVLEEAHEFIPQGAGTPIKKLLTTFALRGRKRGVGMLIISQRSAKVEKSVLTQASFVFLHKVVHPTDLKVYQEILPLPARIVEERVGALSKGDALVLVNHKVHTARVRLRHTYHAGATPTLDADHRANIARADDTLLAELRKLITAPPVDDGKENEEVKRLRSEVTRRAGIISTQKGDIARLNGTVERLTKEVEKLTNQLKRAPVANQATLAANNVQPAPTRPPVASTPAPKPATTPQPSRGVIERGAAAVEREQKRWNVMLADLRRLPQHKKEILVYLTEREETSYSVRQLARALSYEQSTITKNPPLDLISMGLLKRSGTPGQFSYFSTARAKLAEMFPGMNTQGLIVQMIQQLK